ncbi:MAG: lysophospholipid acyltransferase family protein [Candidatus Omnitrophica bacterium]|nr:lysophospholipid acyltransferase family protein [Candidatus Omnitrophota bacterium]MCM8790137.1 lysophospholipid acyltransferase family protein [Candidatus Omnitrophota bacterium]
MILYILYKMGHFFALLLPLKVSYALACVIADIFCFFSTKDRAVVINNLKIITDSSANDKQIVAMAREVFRHFAKYLVDFFRFQKVDLEYIRKFVKIEGEENLRAALANSRGVILLSAHMGNWELGGVIISMMGYPVSGVVLTHQNKKINDFFTRQRLTGNMTPIEIGASLKACYRVLRNNGLLALLGDRDFTKNGLPVKLFGRCVLVPRGPAVFSYRIGSAIVPSFMVRERDDTFRLVFSEPLFADRSKAEEEAIIELAGKYTAVTEAFIRQYPEQWYIFKDIWLQDAQNDMRPDTIV